MTAPTRAPTPPWPRLATEAARRIDDVESWAARPLDELLSDALAAPPVKRVVVFAPLYVSSACANECAYCGFRRTASILRRHLSVDDCVREAEHLVDQGHRTIDLVTGEIATDRFVDHVAAVAAALLAGTGVRRVNLNLGALSTAQYRRLRDAGASGYHLYQETYDPDTYEAVHLDGLKRDMTYRMSAPHRAAEAGFPALGLGVLLGLGSAWHDLAALAAHAQILTEDFPDLKLGFSLPRVQSADAAVGYRAQSVDDETFIRALLYLRDRFPQAGLTLTTRESAALRDRLLPLGITKVSAGVSTVPGGYSNGEPGAPQFDITDERSLDEIVAAIEGSGRIAFAG
ncbi:MAG: radical SAM protein [Proteobacteria bacterium]|nr:radical SAM protein [Pseudomonadota bacterium]